MPSESWVLERLSSALEELSDSLDSAGDGAAIFERSTSALAQLDGALRSDGGVRLLVENGSLRERIEALCGELETSIVDFEEGLDQRAGRLAASEMETVNASLVRLKDVLWSIRHDRLELARGLLYLGALNRPSEVLRALSSMETVLSALDRLEVRGRDSAGLHVLLAEPVLDSLPANLEPVLDSRQQDVLFGSGAIRQCKEGCLSLVYKTAAEIGELGDNGSELRRAIREDTILRSVLDSGCGEVVVLGHTRWASVGLINEANAHPVNSDEPGGGSKPYVVAALNGDVDNYLALCETEALELPSEITTDAKVIPMLISRRLAEGLSLEEAFRRTVASFSGSVAIAAQSSVEPGTLLLALRGSGQALYVGVMDHGFIVASEPYGVVEQTSVYLKMDGETPASLENPGASQGQIVILDSQMAGEIAGIRRLAYDGTELPIRSEELCRATITTRDIDRGAFPHYLLKEISEAADSFRKTLRGKLHDRDGSLEVVLGESTLSAQLLGRIQSGEIDRIVVVGQGTAAIAGRSIADALRSLLPRRVEVGSMPACELSGFCLKSDMKETLVVAISQSGTTTDTNRTVDLVRSRGATVVSIVNRRASDLTDKSDGVLYTSDGRDVEMSVASTKAFYSQIAAGLLLAAALRKAFDGVDENEIEQRMLAGLQTIPSAMEAVLECRSTIARLARAHATSRRHWAVVGNGANRAAAEEVRIKLSELCYKSIACDTTEDKKHIDLSCEPLILVCATGISGSTLDDVAKEVAIYKAHKALPIVIVSEGESFKCDAEVIEVPQVEPSLAFILSTMVGHLFGYEAALAIDALGRPLREIRAQIEELASVAQPGEDLLESLAARIEQPYDRLAADLESRLYDGCLEVSTAIRLASLLRYVRGLSPLDSYISEHGEVASPAVVVEALTEIVTRAIEELTRPVDAIKHQAKTVTVGISRSDEALLTVPLVVEALEAGLPRGRMSYRDLRTLAGLDPAVAEVRGFTRYRITAGDARRADRLQVVDRGGISMDLPSRTSQKPELRGTKHLVSNERELLVARGLSDGRTVILIPEIDRDGVTGILLLHVRFHDTISVAVMRSVLSSYRNRFVSLQDAVMETEPEFGEELLGELSVTDLLCEPLHVLAMRWQHAARGELK